MEAILCELLTTTRQLLAAVVRIEERLDAVAPMPELELTEQVDIDDTEGVRRVLQRTAAKVAERTKD